MVLCVVCFFPFVLLDEQSLLIEPRGAEKVN
jgi:hypothetical protein